MGFDLPTSESLENKIEQNGVAVKLHKLIFKFTDNLKELANDLKIQKGDATEVEGVGTADV